MQERKKDTNQKILLNHKPSRVYYLRLFDRFDPAVGRTSAVGRAYLTTPKLAFAGKFIHYYPCSFVNFSSCTNSLASLHHSNIDSLELVTLHANFKWH